MTLTDRFEGARSGLAISHAFMNLVGQEIGMEKAIALFGRSDEAMGRALGRRIREQHGGQSFDLEDVAETATNAIANGFGIGSEVIAKEPGRIAIRCGRCPVFEAAQSVGIDTGTIETMCRTGSLRFMDAMVKQLNPKLSYHLTKFRSGPEDSCEEEVVLSD